MPTEATFVSAWELQVYKEECTQSSFTYYQGSLVKTFAKTPRHCWDGLECYVLENTQSPILNLFHGQADLLHPLLEDRVSSGLTNDQVCPLHDHNADKEGCMASELHYLPLFVGLRSRQSREHLFRHAAFALWCSHQVQQASIFWLAATKLCLKTYPLLPIAVFHIVNPSVIPLNSDP